MAIRVDKFRILVFILILFQVAAICYRTTLPSLTQARQAITIDQPADAFSASESANEADLQDVLYSPEKPLLSDALVSPIPTFQFGFIVIPACFLFIIFSILTGSKCKERPLFFTNTYFHTLFLSVILINAP